MADMAGTKQRTQFTTTQFATSHDGERHKPHSRYCDLEQCLTQNPWGETAVGFNRRLDFVYLILFIYLFNVVINQKRGIGQESPTVGLDGYREGKSLSF